MPQIFYGWPISGLIVRQAAAYGIDAEGEKPIEFRMERSQAERLTEKIPIERFQMAYIKYNSMAFRNGPVIERLGPDDAE